MEPTHDRRLNVMISSTTVDLPDHRAAASEAIQRAKQTPVMMEHGSAEWNSDAIKFSLEKVEQSQVYVGIFALRYGYIPDDPVRNPERLSITEMEYRHAVKLGIPILIFVAKKTHSFEEDQIDFDTEKREKLKRLKDELLKGICGLFDSASELKTLILQSLQEVRLNSDKGSTSTKALLPTPPELYALPNYILTSTFIGRATELDLLDAWAKSKDPLIVVEGIGGLGKSALTWEWMQNRSTYAIPNLAGRVWYGFYERGASMSAFVRHTLAYITGQDPDALAKESSHYQRCNELLTELNRRPYLLVLDGFERILTAYQRWDKAQQRDDEIDADLRECADPKDADLLRQLLHGSPSKVMLSTRLFPHILQDRASTKPILGVAHHHLNGLSRADTLAYLKHVGIKGNETAMLDFAAKFGNHSLLLKVVCGEIAQYPRKPFDFDAWKADGNYGGKLKLSELDLKQNRSHILHFALQGLDESKRKLLCRIAVLSEDIDYDTLAAINPFLPPKPTQVKEPTNPEQSHRWQRLNDEEKQKRMAGFQQQQEAYCEYQVVKSDYLEAANEARLPFDKALRELQDRGLLQRDRDTGRFDMHPVVRGHAAELLEDGDKKQTFLIARDYFEGLPPEDLDTATEISQVEHSVEIYRCLLGAGLFDSAARFYRGDLANTLGIHLGANTLIVELLTPLFRGGQDGLPNLEWVRDQSYLLNALAIAVGELGREDEALKLYAKTLLLYLKEASWTELGTGLQNISTAYGNLKRAAESAAALALAIDLAEAAEDDDGVSSTIPDQAKKAINQGRFADGERLLNAFRARPLPPVRLYRPGTAEFWSCLSQFYQGKFTEADWRQGYDLAVQHRNVIMQPRFLALRGEWLLRQDQAGPALEAIDEALKIVNRLGTPRPDYHDLRAWALAKLGRSNYARAELAQGEQHSSAAESWLILGDREQARTCALNAYRRAWGEGPPYIAWYALERSKALLRELGEPEPQLPPFDPSKVPPIPHEAEIRAAIAKLKAENKP